MAKSTKDVSSKVYPDLSRMFAEMEKARAKRSNASPAEKLAASGKLRSIRTALKQARLVERPGVKKSESSARK